MAVNVSVVQFRHQHFLKLLTVFLAVSGIDQNARAEITESVAMLEADFMLSMLTQLKAWDMVAGR